MLPLLSALPVLSPADRGTQPVEAWGSAFLLGWAVLAAAGLGLLTALSVGGFGLDDHVLVAAMLQCLALGACGAALRVRRWVRLGTATELTAQFLLAGLLAPLLSVVLASTNLPYRDETLLALDHVLFGFDWSHVIAVAQSRPLLVAGLSHIYASLMQQSVLLFAVLFATGRTDRAQTFCLAWILTLAVTIAIFPLVPALGGYLHLGVARGDTHVLVAAAWRHVEILGPARDGTLLALSGRTLEGIVTFPSFHAAAAALLAWGFWGLPLLRWPALAVNLAMVVATPVVGGHYLVDVAAGLLLAGLALRLAGSLKPATLVASAPITGPSASRRRSDPPYDVGQHT